MNDILLTLIEQNLPPLPNTVIKLRDYIDEKGSKIEIKGVVDIISKDPLATANLLENCKFCLLWILSRNLHDQPSHCITWDRKCQKYRNGRFSTL